MNIQELVSRVRTYTRDFTGSIFREVDIEIFLKEAFNRISIIPELSTVTYPINKTISITLIPESYQYLLPIYASSRCLFQDEQDYRAGTLMNEFETKLEELKSLIESGNIVIVDADGKPIVLNMIVDYVTNIYFDYTIPDDEVIF